MSSGGTPQLRLPFTNVPPGAGFPVGASSFVLSDPGFAAGGQSIHSSLGLWGLEGNAIIPALDKGPFTVSVLGGFRYLNLREDLSITSTETLLSGTDAFAGTDGFATQNQFFGGQIGAKVQAHYEQFDGTVVGKIALGNNYETQSVSGSSLTTGFGGPAGGTVAPGGIFAQSTNIGDRSRNVFTHVPEARVQAGYTFFNALRLFVAYDFIYLANAARPGDQIDTTVNFTSNPTIAGAGSTLTGAARPQPQFKSSSFWAQGVTIGMTAKF